MKKELRNEKSLLVFRMVFRMVLKMLSDEEKEHRKKLRLYFPRCVKDEFVEFV